jgi:hypothetical protein
LYLHVQCEGHGSEYWGIITYKAPVTTHQSTCFNQTTWIVWFNIHLLNNHMCNFGRCQNGFRWDSAAH